MNLGTESNARGIRDGLVGAAGAVVNLATPFLRGARNRWGLAIEETERAYPGDDLVPRPSWMWTHGIEIAAPAAEVWRWVVQIGQSKAGFYSYSWLENLAGCQIANSERVHPEWQRLDVGDALTLHPKIPPLVVAAVEKGRWFVVSSALVLDAPTLAEAEARASWLFFVEPLTPGRCRFISRFRISHGRGWRSRLAYGRWLTESVGFVMDRAMLRGVKRRAESAAPMGSARAAGARRMANERRFP